MRINTKYIKILIVLVVLSTIIVLVPSKFGVYHISVINSALIFYVACLGVTIMLGMCGMVSFAAIAFMGVGGYLSSILSLRLSVNPMISIVISMILTGLFAVIIGMVLMRLHGTFFTFSTIALVQIFYSIFNNWNEVTGGPNGISAIPSFSLFGLEAKTFQDNFYVLFIIAVLCALAVILMKRTTLGRAMSSVKDDEIAAQTMGINIYKTKVIAFAIAAGFAGLAGALLVHNNHFIVSTYFTFDQSTTIIIMSMLGGVSDPVGTFVGSILITMLPELLKPLQEYIRLFYGLGVMIMMIFMPMGLSGTISSLYFMIKRKFKIGTKTMIG